LLANFSAALDRGDVPASSALFGDEAYWRDLLAFTWNIATLEGRSGIAEMLLHTLARRTRP
jgi:putative flavoprotein involved in K+ transport